MLITLPDKVYIIEFKCNQSAEVALQQIRSRGYAEPYQASGNKVIDINFSTGMRTIEAWQAVSLEET